MDSKDSDEIQLDQPLCTFVGESPDEPCWGDVHNWQDASHSAVILTCEGHHLRPLQLPYVRPGELEKVRKQGGRLHSSWKALPEAPPVVALDSPCEFAQLALYGDTPPCWGAVSETAYYDFNGGAGLSVLACEGHKGMPHDGHYREEKGDYFQDNLECKYGTKHKPCHGPVRRHTPAAVTCVSHALIPHQGPYITEALLRQSETKAPPIPPGMSDLWLRAPLDWEGEQEKVAELSGDAANLPVSMGPPAGQEPMETRKLGPTIRRILVGDPEARRILNNG